MINQVNQTNSIYFKGLRENLTTAETVLRKFKHKYPNLRSSTLLGTRIDNLQRVHEPSDSIKQQLKPIKEYQEKIRVACFTHDKHRHWITRSTLNRVLKTHIEEKNALNCGYQIYLLQHDLEKIGIKNKRVRFYITDPQGTRLGGIDHVFSVINMSRCASIKNPSHWGRDAVIIDPWLNQFGSVHEMIAKYKELFNIKKGEGLEFYSEDFFEEPFLKRLAIILGIIKYE